MRVEDYGNADNLMIDRALAEQGSPIIRHAAAADARLRALTAFKMCVRRAARVFAGGGE